MGWRQHDVAEIILFVTKRQKQEMGQRVARLRDGQGMTNESLARKSGLSVKTVSRFVNGKHEPREHTIKSLAKALAVAPEDIRGRPPAPLGLGAIDGQQEQLGQRLEAIEQALANRLDHERKIDAMLREQTAILNEIRRVMRGLPDDEALRLFNEGARQIAAAAQAGKADPAASSAAQVGTGRRPG